MRVELYRFRFFDPIRGRWIAARYRAEKSDIAARYERFEIVGEPEVRDVPDDPLDRFPTRMNR